MDNLQSLKEFLNRPFYGIMKKKLNLIVEWFIRFAFRKVGITAESLLLLHECLKKGTVVIVSYYSTHISFLILYVLLKKNNIQTPYITIDYIPFFTKKFNPFSKNKKGIRGDEIEKAINERKIIFLSLLSKKSFQKRYIQNQFDPIEHLLEIQKKNTIPIILVPELIFWNMNPERTKTVFSSSAIKDRGFVSALWTTRKSISPPFVRTLNPVHLNREIEQSPETDNYTKALQIRERLLNQYYAEKRVVLGPVLKTKRELIEKILYSQNVLDTIREIHEEEGIHEARLRKDVIKYYIEIAATLNILSLNILEKIADYVFGKVFYNIYFDYDAITFMREALRDYPVILAPSHKSYIDFAVLTYIMYKNKIMPPYMAGGVNLSFFPMHYLFRGAGGFFMRRTFRGQKLYGVVFRQYVKTIVSEGYPIEIFIEGGRSRTGKLMNPKFGFLKILLEAYEEGYCKDMLFIPISVTYDRILEENSYHDELKGKAKVGENITQFLDARKLLRKKYGNIYINFDKPFGLKEIMQANNPSIEYTEIVADRIISRINDVTLVTPSALATTAILLTSVKGFTKNSILQAINYMYEYLTSIGVELSRNLKKDVPIDLSIDMTMKSYLADGIIATFENPDRKKYKDSDERIDDLYVLNEKNRSRIVYYKNIIIHYFIPLSYYSLILCNGRMSPEPLTHDGMESEFLFISNLFIREFLFSDTAEKVEHMKKQAMAFLVEKQVVSVSGEVISINEQQGDMVRFFAKIIREFIESYYIVLKTILSLNLEKIDKSKCILEIRKSGIKMLHIGEIKWSESLSVPHYMNGIAKLTDLQYITEKVIDSKNSELHIQRIDEIRHIAHKLDRYLKSII